MIQHNILVATFSLYWVPIFAQTIINLCKDNKMTLVSHLVKARCYSLWAAPLGSFSLLTLKLGLGVVITLISYITLIIMSLKGPHKDSKCTCVCLGVWVCGCVCCQMEAETEKMERERVR